MSFSASHTYGNRAESSGTSRGSAARMPFFNKQPQRFFQPVTRIQPKLKVNAPDDIYEKEADAVADQVMRVPDPQIHRQEEEEVMMKPQPSSVQRKCAECEAEEKLQRKPLAGTITTFIQRKETDGGEVSRQTAALLQSTKSGGRTMPEHTRNWMESRFGTDFSGVKVHTDSNAVQMNRDLHAKAFTHGRDIYFNRGEFTPGTNEGKRLLAHELTHVVQQANNIHTKLIQRLGANPGCTDAERGIVHQAIFNARGWVNNALPRLETNPPSQRVLQALRRNFGPTYGVSANLQLIIDRIRRVNRQMGTIPHSCSSISPHCDQGNNSACGWANPGSNATTICQSPTLTSGSWIYQAGCVLHEAFHATFSNFTVDEYSGWHGHSGSSDTYPGTDTDPLLNADSYTTLIMDLS